MVARQFFNFVRVDSADKCWPWMGCKLPGKRRYGQLKVGGRRGRSVLAHRVSYELHKGPIPPGLDVRHKCDNPECVNPNHLLVGTRKDNMRDMVERGRHLEGREAAASKLRARTHCKSGHVYAESGYYLWKGKGRVCKKCVSIMGAHMYQQRKAK